MVLVSDLPGDLRESVEPFVLHEAGHAVATVALGFELESITFDEFAVGEFEGSTQSSAARVAAANGDSETRCWEAATVAASGRAARRLSFPECDSEWHDYERSDRLAALRHLGRTAVDQEVLAAADKRAQQLLEEPANQRAVRALTTHIFGESSLRTSDDGEQYVALPKVIDGPAVTAVILGAGVKPRG